MHTYVLCPVLDFHPGNLAVTLTLTFGVKMPFWKNLPLTSFCCLRLLNVPIVLFFSHKKPTRTHRTYEEVAGEVEGAEALVYRLVQGDLGLLVDLERRLAPVALHVHRVPLVVVQRVRRHLLQRLDAVADVEPEVNRVADCKRQKRK